MSTQTHGTRPRYAAGCRCTPCRAANAKYAERLRQKKRRGTIILGAIRSSADVKALLEKLHREHFTNTRIAHELGLHSSQVKVHNSITVRKQLRIQRVYRKFTTGGDPPIQAGK